MCISAGGVRLKSGVCVCVVWGGGGGGVYVFVVCV